MTNRGGGSRPHKNEVVLQKRESISKKGEKGALPAKRGKQNTNEEKRTQRRLQKEKVSLAIGKE